MPRVLKDITITEVSAVDRGAGRGVKVLLMKRDKEPTDMPMTDAEIQALVVKSVTEGVATAVKPLSEEIAKRDREIAILKLEGPTKEYFAKLDAAGQTAFLAVKDEDRAAYMTAHPHIEKATSVDHAELAKRDETIATQATALADMKKRIDASDLEKSQASFAKRAKDLGLTEPTDGEIMRKAYGGDAEAQVKLDERIAAVQKAATAQGETAALFKEFGHVAPVAGDAMTQINALAETVRKSAETAGKPMTTEQAFTKVWTDPANREIVGKAKTEDMRKRQLAA